MKTSQMTPVLPAVSAFLRRDHGLYINGRWTPSDSTAKLRIFDPATGQVIAHVVDASASDVDRAVRAAHDSFADGRWRGMLPAGRERILLRFADLVESHAEELAQLETLEQGKGIAVSRSFEVGGSVAWMRYTAGLTTKISGRTFDVSIPAPPGVHFTSYTRRESVGVVAGIVPFNFPLMIGLWKIMPALAAGCSAVIKPSDTTPLTLLRIAELASEAGVPDGVLNIVTGAVCGSALTTHRLVAKVSFTGSTGTGRLIARSAIDRFTRVTLELGGKNPAIVLADADPKETVSGLVAAGFLNQGQVCAACSRIYVEAPMFDTLAEGLERAIKTMAIGPGLDPTADINPLVSAAQKKKVESYIDDARSHGATLVDGGAVPNGNGFYVRPTLVLNPDNTVKLTREEVFGPVLTITRVADAEEAIRSANDSDLGLAASLWTTSLKAAMDMTPRIEAGTVGQQPRDDRSQHAVRRLQAVRDRPGLRRRLARRLHRGQVGLHPALTSRNPNAARPTNLESNQ
jgi:phenylacetaldehyde dehydrogenase